MHLSINILFLIGISLCTIYFLQVINARNDYELSNSKLASKSKRVSILFLFILFILSVFCLDRYQNPNSKVAYFKNTNYFALSNYGVSFNNEIDLYGNNLKSLWSDGDIGELKATISNDNIYLFFNDFKKPVFYKKDNKTSFLLNPIYQTFIDNEFVISDGKTTISWLKFNSLHSDNSGEYSMKIRIISTDDEILKGISKFDQTILIEKIKINKGIKFIDILKSANSLDSIQNIESVKELIENTGISSCQILSYDDTLTSKSQLVFFPNNSFADNFKIYKNKKEILPIKSTHSDKLKMGNSFYIGLENSSHPLLFRKQNNSEINLFSNNQNILEFNYLNYMPLSTSFNDTVSIGSSSVKFLTNNYDNLLYNNIRDGYVFHDGISSNQFNNYYAFLKFTNDKSNIKLDWDVISSNVNQKATLDKTHNVFSILSENKQNTWLFKIVDFSKNKFSNLHLVSYLLCITLLFSIILIFFPGKNLIAIEFPLYVIIYLFMTYRFLLLWRVATFPPINNISNIELDTLLNFDFKFIGFNFPIPISFLILVAFCLSIMIYRYRKLYPKREKNNTFNQKLLVVFSKIYPQINPYTKIHGVVLFISALVLQTKIEILTRIFGILIPIISSFLIEKIIIEKNIQFKSKLLPPSNKLTLYLYKTFNYWVYTPVFIISFLTFTFFLFTDKGFAVLYLLYLLIKNIFLNFSLAGKFDKKSKLNYILNPSNKILYALIFLFTYLFLIANKSTFYYLIQYKVQILILGFITIFLIIFFLFKNSKIIFIILFPFLLSIIFFNKQLNSILDQKIKNVKFRTSILFKPLESILFSEKYNSSNERKIIETAENQWYINSYINPNDSYQNQGYINIRPHFMKGVDYSTQTRDLIVPRYIIAEFGNITILLLLFLLILPIIFYIITFRISNKQLLYANSTITLCALLLVFTLGLFVWLTSTNRFVFFGQDFPFLSLTSRLSCLLPLSLFFILLTSHPTIKNDGFIKTKERVIPFALFIVVLFLVIAVSGKTNYLDESVFRIDFSKVQQTFEDKINPILNNIQSNNNSIPKNDIVFNDDLYENNREQTLKNIKKVFDQLQSDTSFQNARYSLNTYERSILDDVLATPIKALNATNPLTVQIKNDQLGFVFNQNWRLELPAYDLKKVWKGDVLQTDFGNIDSKDVDPTFQLKHIFKDEGNIVIIPKSYLNNSTNDIGLLDLNTSDGLSNSLNAQLFNISLKSIRNYTTTNFSPILDNSTISFINNNKSVHVFSMDNHNKKYFAYSYNINGYQKIVYPLAQNFFWIKNWTDLLKDICEQNGNFNYNSTLNLDYSLTESVSKYLLSKRKKLTESANSKELTFSVIAADGLGRISLMCDYANIRPVINPNNTKEYLKEISNDFFSINPNIERQKWGNLNLLRMDIGPGSSVKPLISSTIASQLNLGWENLKVNGDVPTRPINGNIIVRNYAGLKIGNKGWDLEKPNSGEIDFNHYLSYSDNVYHSVLIFLGSYEKSVFFKNGNYNLKNILDPTPFDSLSNYPKLIFNGGPYYLPSIKKKGSWPVTEEVIKKEVNYFGNVKSLLADGIDKNLKLKSSASNVFNNKNIRLNDFTGLPVTENQQGVLYDYTKKWVWSFPEESYFLHSNRVGLPNDLLSNFNVGIRNTTLGGSPYMVTPYSILEMYGKLASQNSAYSLKIDTSNSQSQIVKWSIDSTWESSSFNNFLSKNIFEGMKGVVVRGKGGTLQSRLNRIRSSNIISNGKNNNFYVYAKTGTAGNKTEGSSKRLALLITKDPIIPQNISSNKFYLVYFTVGKAYKHDGKDRTWFYSFYNDILDQIINSDSFIKYMK